MEGMEVSPMRLPVTGSQRDLDTEEKEDESKDRGLDQLTTRVEEWTVKVFTGCSTPLTVFITDINVVWHRTHMPFLVEKGFGGRTKQSKHLRDVCWSIVGLMVGDEVLK